MTPEQRIAAAPRAWTVKYEDEPTDPDLIYSSEEAAQLDADLYTGARVVPVAIVELPEEDKPSKGEG